MYGSTSDGGTMLIPCIRTKYVAGKSIKWTWFIYHKWQYNVEMMGCAVCPKSDRVTNSHYHAKHGHHSWRYNKLSATIYTASASKEPSIGIRVVRYPIQIGILQTFMLGPEWCSGNSRGWGQGERVGILHTVRSWEGHHLPGETVSQCHTREFRDVKPTSITGGVNIIFDGYTSHLE